MNTRTVFHFIILIVAVGFARWSALAVPTYEIVHAFERGPTAPAGPLQVAADGTIYGTSNQGGAHGLGTIFRIATDGSTKILASFTGTAPGAPGNPAGYRAGITPGPDGAFYGVAYQGGTANAGTAFKITTDGTFTLLREFGGATGSFPGSPLVLGGDGNFYGTTASGGTSNFGTAFRMTTAGVVTTLANFTGTGGNAKGQQPNWLMLGSDGNFYGTAARGGAGDFGVVFKMTAAGVVTTLAEFTGNTGATRGTLPVTLAEALDGTLVGTTQNGGQTNNGTVFRVTRAGVFTTLAQFQAQAGTTLGSAPAGGLARGTDGSFYGTTTRTGSSSGGGTVFKLSPAGQLTTLVQFTNLSGSAQGSFPAGLVRAPDGSFYGPTSTGGESGGTSTGLGTIFKITPDGAFTTVIKFVSGVTLGGGKATGVQPEAALVEDTDGSFFGTTLGGGGKMFGTVFRMTRAGVVSNLADFTGIIGATKGTAPKAPLVASGDGTFSGTTIGGGAGDLGTVFRIDRDGTFTTLAELGAGGTFRGAFPVGPMARDSTGNLFGVAISNNGTAFKISPTGVFTLLYSFGAAGRSPSSGLFMGADGNLYGATSSGSANGSGVNGTLFRMSPLGAVTTLVDFTEAAKNPEGQLATDPAGNIYGTTSGGGATGVGLGAVFRWSPTAGLSKLADFTGGINGRQPKAGVVRHANGSLYGMTEEGGINALGPGIIFRVSPAGAFQSVVQFTGTSGNAPGDSPTGALLAASDGNLYGATPLGGAAGGGVIFRLRLGPTPVTGVANQITQTTATLRGTVNPNGASTTATFNWGTTEATGNTTANVLIGTGTSTVPVNATLAGLRPGTTYYYRARATNAENLVAQTGEIRSFTTLPDTMPPVLTLLGPNPLTLECPALYQEPGATAQDDVAGNITAAIQTTSDVNTNAVGTYAVTYTVSDGFNTATATRTVRVVDTIPPTITILGANPVTIYAGTPYVDSGAAASDTCAGNLTPAIQVGTNVNSSLAGIYTVTYTVSDGYNAATTTRTVRVVDQPVAGMDTLGTMKNTPVSAPAVKLLANDSDPNGHPLSVASISPASANGGTVTLGGGLLTYTPPAGFMGLDSFTYTISDGFGGTATGTVNVTVSGADGASLNQVSMTRTADGFLVSFAGIPGDTYLIQFADSLTPPVTWMTLTPPGPIQAGPNGLFQFEDKPNPIPPQRFYRAAIPQ